MFRSGTIRGCHGDTRELFYHQLALDISPILIGKYIRKEVFTLVKSFPNRRNAQFSIVEPGPVRMYFREHRK
jgi:hypothetical protein